MILDILIIVIGWFGTYYIFDKILKRHLKEKGVGKN